MIGIGLMCAALFCFSCLDATAKWVNQSVDPMVTVWARYMSAALLTFMVINPRTQPGALSRSSSQRPCWWRCWRLLSWESESAGNA
jgi:hypothetical protein